MTAPDRLIEDYLRRLRRAAKALPRSRRDELMSEITQHLEAAGQAGETADVAGTRQVLDRLGDPELIVRAEAANAVRSVPSLSLAAAPRGAAVRSR